MVDQNYINQMMAKKAAIEQTRAQIQSTKVPEYDNPYRRNPIAMGIASLAMGVGEGMTGRPFLTNFNNNLYEQKQAQLKYKQWQEQQQANAQKEQLDMQYKQAQIDNLSKKNVLSADGLTPEQQLSGYALAVKTAGQRKASDVAPLIYGMMKQGKTKDEIEDELRYSGQSQEFTGAIRDAAQAVYSGSSETRAQNGMDYIDDLLSKGNKQAALKQIKKAARDQADVTTRQQIQGKERTVEFLNEIQSDLDTLRNAGIDTNIFSGTKENILAKVGKITDTDLRKIATKMTLAMFNYRRAMSGVAFPEAETREYRKVFPDITKDYGMNAAQIDALKQTFGGDVDYFYKSSIGDSYDQLFKSGGTPETNVNKEDAENVIGSGVGAYKDAEKEARYQAWKKSQVKSQVE